MSQFVESREPRLKHTDGQGVLSLSLSPVVVDKLKRVHVDFFKPLQLKKTVSLGGLGAGYFYPGHWALPAECLKSCLTKNSHANSRPDKYFFESASEAALA